MTEDNVLSLDKPLHAPLKTSDPARAALFMDGGYNRPGYGVPEGACVDGSFALGGEGSQGYYVGGGKEIFLSTTRAMRDFFSRREKRFGKPLKLIIKPGIGGQHTPFQGIADVFAPGKKAAAVITGEYELGKDYRASIEGALKKLGAGWDQVAVIPSSKSGSTDETMLIFTEIFYLLLENVAALKGADGALFARTVFDALHRVNFDGANERAPQDLFKGFSLKLVEKELAAAGAGVPYAAVREIFGTVLGNMFFETTDRPRTSRLSAFIRNSGLDKELGPDSPGFGAMFDNVGGRWTADLHMMTFLAYYGLDAEKYWSARHEGIKKVRGGAHEANALARELLEDGVTDIALVVPDGFFWFGKAVEQNFNESIWQEGFANLIAVKQSEWRYQKARYERRKNALVIDLKKLVVENDVIDTLAELFTFFYGFTHCVGNALITRALRKEGYGPEKADLSDLDNPATRIVQRNLYLRQPYVELGKGLLEKKLKDLQVRGGKRAIEEEYARVRASAKEKELCCNIGELSVPRNIASARALSDAVKAAASYARSVGRKFVPFLYLDGEKFFRLREHIMRSGAEWVMQGTADQHISYQQVLARPKAFLPFIISFVAANSARAHPAIGFAKGYLDNVSQHLARDAFAEASYRALIGPRTDEAGNEITGAAALFLRLTDSEEDIVLVKGAF
jgi:hypothetical protein